MRRSPWALIFLAPLAASRPYAEVGDGRVVVEMGLLGHADIPVALIDRVGTVEWPWWGGVGVRIAKGMVAFLATGGGRLVLIELSERIDSVRAPLRWRTSRIAFGAEDVEGMIAAIAEARRPGATDGAREVDGP